MTAHEDEEQGEVFFDESDIINEIDVDEEDLPDAEDDIVEDSDDSIHIFTGHTEFVVNLNLLYVLHAEDLFSITIFPGELYAVACSPTDPVLVATGGGDDKGFLWKIGHADWAFELQGHTDSVSSLAFSHDGQLLASGGHTDSVSSLAFSHDGQLLASGGFDGLVKVWDTSGNLKSTLEGPGGGIEWIRWHPKGHLILAGSEDCTVWMWNADNGSCLNVFSGHGASVTCGDFTPDGKTICTGSEDATLRIWNPRSGESIHVVRGHSYHTEGLTCLSINSDSTFAITGSKDGSVHVVNITIGKVVSSWASQTSSTEGDTESIECVSFAPKFPWAVSGGMDRNLTIWDLQNSSPRFICNHEEGVTCLAWLGASKFLATGCCDGRICIWNCLSGECVETFKGHEHAIQSLSVSSNLEFLVSVSMDGTARVFEIRNFH
ncbi:angio-associated migratory cell protein-like [Gossypium australe]|uniref:Angio-associated migratory cell protein-like n=1 Tax=Gossypium australe TaxID=47621 RepID=A0A5B6UJF7_9ROSI|nr:angio-associated migratory cell protein-like [Gossypium australe]